MLLINDFMTWYDGDFFLFFEGNIYDMIRYDMDMVLVSDIRRRLKYSILFLSHFRMVSLSFCAYDTFSSIMDAYLLNVESVYCHFKTLAYPVAASSMERYYLR